MSELVPRQHWFWTFARPSLLWACIPLLFLALHPDVSDAKFNTAAGLAVLLALFRGFLDKGLIERLVTIWRGSTHS